MKKKVCIILMILLLFTSFTGCNKPAGNEPSSNEPTNEPSKTTAPEPTDSETKFFNESGFPIVNQPVKYRLLAPRTSLQGDWDEMWIFKEIEELTGVSFDIETVDQAGWEEKKSLVFATKELPDLFITGLSKFDIINYGTQGILIQLNELLEKYAPSVMMMLDETPAYLKTLRAPDGNIYTLPPIVNAEREFSARRFYINTTWAQKMGIETPKTLDEFYDYLKAVKENDPNGNGENDEIPVGGVFNTGSALDIPILVALGYKTNRIDLVNDKVVYVPIEDKYRHYLEYMKKLHYDKLLDSEYFTQTDEQFRAKGSQGLYGTFSYSASWTMMAEQELYDQYWMIPPMTSEYNSEQIWPASKSLNTGLSIVNTCENPEVLIRLFDYFYTPEGRIMARVGPASGEWEGEGGYRYEENDKGEKYFVFDFPDKYASFNEFREQVILPMSLPYGDDGVMAGYFQKGDPRQQKLTINISDNCVPYYQEIYPSVYFTKEENDQLNLFDTDINTYVAQMEAKFITGEEDLTDENWNAFIEGVKSRGVEEMLKIRQDAYDRVK